MSKEVVQYVDPNKLTIIGLDTDHKEGEHPLWDKRIQLDLDEALVRNILLNGVQQAVKAREMDGQIVIVDGRQRVRCAREAKLRQGSSGEYEVKVPVSLTVGNDRRVVGIMISLNENRRDDSILDKAANAVRMRQMGMDKSEIAIHFGRSVQTIGNWFRLDSAIPEIHAAIREGKISPSVGIDLAAMGETDQLESLNKILGPKDEAKKEKEKVKQPKAHQAGVRRTWLRKALKTDAALALQPEERATLVWFSTGVAEEGTWFRDFVDDAAKELGEGV